MKNIRIFVFLFVFTVSLFAHAVIQINCIQNEAKVLIEAKNTDMTFPHININGSSVLVQLDPYSAQTENDLYSDFSIETTQVHHNSILVFSVPHGSIQSLVAGSFPGQLQYRDYDDGYQFFEHLDQGPLKNGYALGEGSLLKLNCEKLDL